MGGVIGEWRERSARGEGGRCFGRKRIGSRRGEAPHLTGWLVSSRAQGLGKAGWLSSFVGLGSAWQWGEALRFDFGGGGG
jgi:hypothetical protein